MNSKSLNSLENLCPLNKIKIHLIKLSKKYNLGNVLFKRADGFDDVSSFIIEVPKTWEYKKILKIWDEIIDDTVSYAENENLISCLNKITIILR